VLIIVIQNYVAVRGNIVRDLIVFNVISTKPLILVFQIYVLIKNHDVAVNQIVPLGFDYYDTAAGGQARLRRLGLRQRTGRRSAKQNGERT